MIPPKDEKKMRRRRPQLYVTLNKHTLVELQRLAELMGMSRSAVIDEAVRVLTERQKQDTN